MARERLLEAAVRQFLSERAPPAERTDDVTTLVAGAARLRVTGDSIADLGQQVEGVPRPDAMSDLSGDIEPVCAWYAALGAALGEQASPPAPAAAGSELPPGVLEGLREAAVIGDRARIVAAVVVGCGWEHLDLVRSLENQIAGAAARLTPVGGEALSGIDPLVP